MDLLIYTRKRNDSKAFTVGTLLSLIDIHSYSDFSVSRTINIVVRDVSRC
jgi:hypothetical protein